MGAGGEVDEGEAHERGRFDVCPPDKLCQTIAYGVGLFAMLVDGGGNVSEVAEAWFVQQPRIPSRLILFSPCPAPVPLSRASP
jgi:hypothetical protein